MRNTTKKLLVLFAIVALMVAALAVSAFAYVSWDAEQGTFPGGTKSGFADINSSAWVQIAAKKAVDADGDGAYTSEGDLLNGNAAFRAYFNESTGTLVIENDSATSITGGNTDHSTVSKFANWAKTNADKITTLELRNVNHFNNLAYVIGKLTSVKTIKLYDKCNAWNGSKSDTAAFAGLTAFDTLYWGTWDAATGEYTKTCGEEGVVDLSPMLYLDVMTTTYNGTHYVMYSGNTFYNSGVKKIVLPYSQVLRDQARTMNAIAISDGTFVEANPSAPTPGATLAKNKACTIMVNTETGETGYTTHWSIPKPWAAVKWIAADTAPYYGDYTGLIPYQYAKNAKNLAEVVVPANVTLQYIEAEAFSGCTALKLIDIKGAVATDMVIENKNAFGSVTGLTIQVYSDLDKVNMEKALTAAGVTGVTVVTTKVEEPEGGDSGVVLPNVITADGFMLRTNSYNGLRALFSFDEDKATAVAAETGYTLVEYGAIASSAKSYEKAGSSEALLAQANGKSIQRIVIFADDGTGLNKYVDVDAKQYCIAVRDFEGENVLKDIYVSGYAIWSNGTDTVITFSDYVTKTGKNVISLYTLTLEMYKAGAINAQMVTDSVCLWDVLSQGAWSVTEADVKAPSDLLTLTQGFEYDENGEFTYLDLPLRAWNMYKNASGNLVWNSRGASVEAESTTNVLWSILVDGDNLVVVYRAASDDTATLPKLSDQYGASAPYSSNYFLVTAASQVTEDTSVNGLLKTATLYSPILTDANAKKVQTLVIDYGVDNIGTQSLDDAKKSNNIGTVVYPDGIEASSYLLAGCHALENFICATANKSYLDAYDVASLVDLTGLARVGLTGITQNAASVQNLLLPVVEKISGGEQYGFGGASALTRVWTVGTDMPEAGVMDLTNTPIKLICKGFFNNLNNIDDIYMPDSFVGINAYSLTTKNQTTDTARWFIFGDNKTETKLNIHVANWDALNAIANTFYEARQSIEYNDNKDGDPNGIAHVVDYLKITYNGETKTVLEWREAFPEKPAA